jgi:phosphate transport system ATP-binding protein
MTPRMRPDSPIIADRRPPAQSGDEAPLVVAPPVLAVEKLSVRVGARVLLRDVSLTVEPQQVLGLVGPSGAGKSTLLRALNRMLDLQPGFHVSGTVRLSGLDTRAAHVDADELRRRIGMVFQQPAVFPASIADNVLFGARHHRSLSRTAKSELIEANLRAAGLWTEVKDRLHDSGLRLSVGQQQRLCLARTLAVDPEIILMDEPTSALDARATEQIEQLILELKRTRTIVLVTHNLEQARRVTDWVTCLCRRDGAGEVLDSACCDAFFANPICQAAFSDDDAAPANGRCC